MKAYDKYEVDEIFKCWSSDLAELNVIEVIPLKMLDKIIAEIEQDAFKDVNGSKFISVNRVNQIINKYRAESEEEDVR